MKKRMHAIEDDLMELKKGLEKEFEITTSIIGPEEKDDAHEQGESGKKDR